jgi:hypothetical protein
MGVVTAVCMFQPIGMPVKFPTGMYRNADRSKKFWDCKALIMIL